MTHSIEYSQLRVCIVSAWWPEQSELAARLANRHPMIVVSHSLRVVGPYAFLTTGIGTPRAAAAVSAALMQAIERGARIESLYFVATAGAYHPDVALNSAFLVSSAHWADSDLASGRSYLPNVERSENLNATRFCQNANQNPSQPAMLSAVSTPGITLKDDVARSLAHLAGLENLEVYGVAMAAHSLGIPWAAALGVSNTVGAQAHEQWKAHHDRASRSAQMLLLNSFAEDFEA
jgi:nucleoside phosphorylase